MLPKIGLVSVGSSGLYMVTVSSTSFVKSGTRYFDDLSCVSDSKLCSVSFAIPFSNGLLVLDGHRLVRFNLFWNRVQSALGQLTELGMMVNSFGSATVPSHLKHPTSVCIYEPYNSTHISSAIDPVFRTGYQISTIVDSGTFAFVADTGNDRVCVFNITSPDQLEISACITVPRPLHTAIMFGPSWEPTISTANIFVTTLDGKLVKLNFMSGDGTLVVSSQLDLPCPGNGIDILNAAIVVVVLKCEDNITSGIQAITVDVDDSSKMSLVDFFHSPSNFWLFGQILVTYPDITGQKSIILTGGDLHSVAISSLFITVSLPRNITIMDRPSRALNFLNTCFNASVPPPLELVKDAVSIFNASISVIDALYTTPQSFNYDFFNQIFFVPYRRVVIYCASGQKSMTESVETFGPPKDTISLPITTNGCLVIIIITCFVI